MISPRFDYRVDRWSSHLLLTRHCTDLARGVVTDIMMVNGSGWLGPVIQGQLQAAADTLPRSPVHSNQR